MPARGVLPSAKADGCKSLLEQLGLQVFGHRAFFVKSEILHCAHEARFVLQKVDRGAEDLAQLLTLTSALDALLGPTHFPSHNTAADVVLPTVAQNRAAQLLVDVLYAGALVIHAPKRAGFFALQVLAVQHAGDGQDDLSLAQCLVFLLNRQQISVRDQPVDVAFQGVRVHWQGLKQFVQFSCRGSAFVLGVKQVHQLIGTEFISAQVLVNFAIGGQCRQYGVLYCQRIDHGDQLGQFALAHIASEVRANDHSLDQIQIVVPKPCVHALFFGANLATLVGQLLQ